MGESENMYEQGEGKAGIDMQSKTRSFNVREQNFNVSNRGT